MAKDNSNQAQQTGQTIRATGDLSGKTRWSAIDSNTSKPGKK